MDCHSSLCPVSLLLTNWAQSQCHPLRVFFLLAESPFWYQFLCPSRLCCSTTWLQTWWVQRSRQRRCPSQSVFVKFAPKQQGKGWLAWLPVAPFFVPPLLLLYNVGSRHNFPCQLASHSCAREGNGGKDGVFLRFWKESEMAETTVTVLVLSHSTDSSCTETWSLGRLLSASPGGPHTCSPDFYLDGSSFGGEPLPGFFVCLVRFQGEFGGDSTTTAVVIFFFRSLLGPL